MGFAGGGPQYVMKPIYEKVYLQIIGQDSPNCPLNTIEVNIVCRLLEHYN